MKPHLILRLRLPRPGGQVGHWVDHARGAVDLPGNLLPGVDRILKQYALPVRVAQEYAPASPRGWTPEEIEAGLNRTYRLILAENTRLSPQMIHSITLLPEIETVRPGAIGVSGLPVVAQAMARQPNMQPRQMIGLPEAQSFTRGNPSVTVAILDTGVSLTNPEYRHALVPGFDFVDIIDGADEFVGDFLGYDAEPIDEVGHGSHVAGIIAARGLKMPRGVVPECKLLPVRVLGAMRQGDRTVGAGLIDNINTAVKWAVDKGANVINMSLGVEHTGGGLPHEEVVAYARNKGVTIVAASGNDGTNRIYYPSGHPYVITVGAADQNRQMASFSTHGNHVDFLAPGTDIYSSSMGDGYAFSTGTSHAAPFVSGAAAMLISYARSRGRNLSDKQIKHVLKHSSDKMGKSFKDTDSGYGLLNLSDALKLLEHKLN